MLRLVTSPIGSVEKDSFESMYRVVTRTSKVIDRNNATITNSLPECGGGGSASEEVGSDCAGAENVNPAKSDDDDGGDDDADPDRRSLIKRPSPSGKHRNATATAGAHFPTNPLDISLWRLPTVLQHVPISRSGWWAGVKAGRYPAPVRLSTRCVAWKSEDIRALINSL